MALKLTAESFLAGVRASGLIEPKVLDETLSELKRHGRTLDNATDISNELEKRGLITHWQAEKLLQGRHKGFILGRYKLMNLLGRGEMSAVYLAEHVAMQRRCAIKVLPANRVKDTSYLGRFQREARAVASLDHANIVRAYDVDQQNEGGAEIHFLVMEYVEGQSVEALVKKNGPLPFAQAADIVRQAAEGLAHAHQAGLVHRDIKPGNLLVNESGAVKLLDLGLARFFKEDGEESLTIKHDEKVLGTADYLAPEQAVDSHNVDERGDVYSLGCTFYFALTGHPPFTDGTLVQRLLAHQTRQPPSIKVDRPDIDDGLLAIVEKMMAKRRESRYQTARELADALTAWLAQNGTDEWKRKNIHLISLLYGTQHPTVTQQMQQTTSGNRPERAQSAPRGGLEGAPVSPALQPRNKAGQRPQQRPRPKPNSVAGKNAAHTTRRKVSQSKNSNKLEARWIWIGIAVLAVTAGVAFGISYWLFGGNSDQTSASPAATINSTES
ncbi:serine/threonine-protein kinase [Rubinisphaera brasiliensis]|uniref:non-specific serine/threonine protein kinase n=1 Tax=Rubinisphaera brasiliensis (strain ATCC 49424 / DSM 5305 / JCM 21570 / IAM 15109 / NBRC 103401 / IFAM 1448) TaxID=756272 RepID=F0SK70_RUBBR|nr:serine/threonine-protein kinase [Rubinisphaera brasiliensis]ADY59797.1 serine/threonine protein kinase [Rubinisphaera brasiliensis DSM 5305]